MKEGFVYGLIDEEKLERELQNCPIPQLFLVQYWAQRIAGQEVEFPPYIHKFPIQPEEVADEIQH